MQIAYRYIKVGLITANHEIMGNVCVGYVWQTFDGSLEVLDSSQFLVSLKPSKEVELL